MNGVRALFLAAAATWFMAAVIVYSDPRGSQSRSAGPCPLATVGSGPDAERSAPPGPANQSYALRISDFTTTGRGGNLRMLLIAARDGATEAAVKAVEAVGGTVRVRYDDLGYVRAIVPRSFVKCLLDASSIENLSADLGRFELDRAAAAREADEDDVGHDQAHAEQRESSSSSDRDPSTIPDPGGPRWVSAQTWRQGAWQEDPFGRPYHPLADMRAAEWRREHPTYDGRGVVIAVQEGLPDLLQPELASAKALDGASVPKILDYLTTDNPEEAIRRGRYERERRVWVRMVRRVATETQAIDDRGRAYVAPRPGSFRIGTFVTLPTICDAALEWAPLIDRRASRPCEFPLLWDPESGEVWLDTNRNRDFSDERALYDYSVRRDVGVIGRDHTASRGPDSFSFVVRTRPASGHVAILLGSSEHATTTAVSAAGSAGDAGRTEGIAPGAQILWLDSGRTAESEGQALEGLIAAFLDPRVDVVLSENNYLFRRAGPRGDGRNVSTIIVNRLIATTGKPFVAPATNQMKDAGIDPLGQVDRGFAAGASQGRASWWINRGLRVQEEDNLHRVGAFGPGDDGSIQPTVLAPSGWLVANRRRNAARGRPAFEEGLYQLPPEYVIGGGTSQAAPTLAGALALLISAAKQEDVPYDAERLWRAVTSSARFAPHIPAYQQGHGFLDVEAAWELLRRHATAPSVVNIESRGPLRTAWSHRFKTPHQGVGLFERDGWSPGMRETRSLWLTRTSGPRMPMTFDVSWLGNDGTFVAPTSVTLPLNEPVALPVAVAPRTSGYHSALLNLGHRSVPGYAHRLMTAVVAAEPFNEENGYTIVIDDALERPNAMASYYVSVPAHAAALTVEASAGESNTFFMWGPQPHEPFQEVALVRDPEAGVWGVGNLVEPSLLNALGKPREGTSPVDLRWWNAAGAADPPALVRFALRLLGANARFVDGPKTIRKGASTPVTVEIHNTFGAFVGGVISSSLGNGRLERERVTPGEQHVHEIAVPSGSEMLVVDVSCQDDRPAPDVSLFDCTGSTCTHVRTVDGQGARRLLRQSGPKAGRWKAVVESPFGDNETCRYEYREVVLDPALGGVISTDAARPRAVGERWRTTLHAWRSAAEIANGRSPWVAAIVEAILPDRGKVPVDVLTAPLKAR